MQHTHGARTYSLGEVWRLFLPLSFSDIIMVLSGPILTAGLARLPDVTVNLAAYSVAESVCMVIESPVIMLLHASTALARSPMAFRALRRFMLLLALLLTALHALVAFTPLYDTVFAGWLHQPGPVVDAGRHAMRVMLLWSAAIGWRRFYQGLLIVHRRSTQIFRAALGRLGTVAATVLLGVLFRLNGALVAGLALQLSVLVEAGLITHFALPLQRTALAAPEPPEAPGLPRSFPGVSAWYAPLIITALLAWTARPFVNAAIARAEGATLALAAWPVAWTTYTLLADAVRMVQQLVITLVRDAESYRILRRFALLVTAVVAAGMTVLTFTPLARLYLEQVIGVSGDLAAVTLVGLRILFLIPALSCWQNFYQGLLIRRGQTGLVNAAAAAGGLTLIAGLIAGVVAGRWGGMAIAAVATLVSLLVELSVLWLATRSARAELGLAA